MVVYILNYCPSRLLAISFIPSAPPPQYTYMHADMHLFRDTRTVYCPTFSYMYYHFHIHVHIHVHVLVLVFL